MPGPLNGIRVIDLTRVLAGPYCTMMLADLGAEIIKIERPETGDDSRAFGPFLNGHSAYFMSINRGKKSMTLNLKNPEAKKIFMQLVEKADVVVENFKPGVMKKLGIDYKALSGINNRLVFASSTGFGQTGPYTSRPAYDLIIQGMGGMMSITGPSADQPSKVGSSIADIISGMFTAFGIVNALYAREKTGKGQAIDVAMLDSMIAVLENAIVRFSTTNEAPVPIGNRHPSIAPFSSFSTSDGLINIAIGNDDLWKKFCELIGKAELSDDSRFKGNAERVKNWYQLFEILKAVFVTKKTDEWLELFQKNDIPSGPINDVKKIFADPQVKAREMLLELIHPIAGKITVPGNPVKFSETPAKVASTSPLLGEHTDEILSGILKMSSEEIAAMKKSGAI
ncbi:MAG: CoA transferase [Candidatus Riflebacteria bacterium]|nr:CoA transferase [Candidatus Riflebacteria bacterium]